MSGRVEILGQLYSELRAYRSKEFQTFIFAFPIIGAGYLSDFSGNNEIKQLLSAFCASVLIYIWFNHVRMMKIKEEIVNFQELVGVNSDFKHLDPHGWVKKRFLWHLGTTLYMLLLIVETSMLWV